MPDSYADSAERFVRASRGITVLLRQADVDPSVLENELVVFDAGLQNGERHFRRRPKFGTDKVARQPAKVRASSHSAHRPVCFCRTVALCTIIGLSPSSVLIFSMTAATRPRFAMAIAFGVLSSPSRAAVSEKQNSSSVKCSEILMRLSVGCEFHREHVPALRLRPQVLPDHSR